MVKLTWRHWGERPHQLLIDKAQSPCGMPWLIQFERGERRKIFKNILFQLSSFSGGSLRSKIDYDYTNLFIHISCVAFFFVRKSCKMLKMMCWSWYDAYGLSNLLAASRPSDWYATWNTHIFLSHETLLFFWWFLGMLRISPELKYT